MLFRSPGRDTTYAVVGGAYINRDGYGVSYKYYAVAPALQINLSSDFWHTSDDGTSGEGGGSGTGSESEDNRLLITSNPANQSVNEGTSVTFHITARGGTPSNYTYQWYYATTQSGTGTRINGAATSSYTIPSDNVSTALDGRYYYCIVSNGQYDVESERAKLTVTESGQNNPTDTPANPVHDCTKEDDGTDTTTWSYVYFGSYPQTEVIGDALTEGIIGADYNSNGDAWVNGTKYRRISDYDSDFEKNVYRYFKWERIKWRVLENNGSMLFVVADQGLDCKDYNEADTSITWENCTLRTWLNGTFYNTAFSSSEQDAIVQQTVVNDDNPKYGTAGGNNTQDNVYLLSIEEVTNPEYGFCEDYGVDSASRWMQPSDYTHAMRHGDYTDEEYGCWWWLRSPGSTTDHALYVNARNLSSSDRQHGNIKMSGFRVTNVYKYDVGIMPALQINLSSDLWYTSDDGTSGEGGGSGTGDGNEGSGTENGNEGSGTGNGSGESAENGTGNNANDKNSGTEGNDIANNNVIGNQNNQTTPIEQGNAKYTITDTTKKTVEYTAPTSKNPKTVTIPDSIKINDTVYTVTSIAAKAFKGNKTLTKVTIGKNVKTIGKQAFYKCQKLKKVTVKTTRLTAKTVGAKAFQGIAKKAAITVPAKKLSAYKKILKKKGITGKGQKIKK